jgi:MerR family transcriptional regulator, mercuric resistance operon regulatory protein
VPTITTLRQEGLSIGQLSRRTGVNLETIRYYERIGILTRPPRTAAGHRVYGDDHVRMLAFIHRARELAFPLADIRALLALRGAGPSCCPETRDIAVRHLEGIRLKISTLSHLVHLLEEATDPSSASMTRCCPVMDLLHDTTQHVEAGPTSGSRAHKQPDAPIT